jgi:hypothetical protein
MYYLCINLVQMKSILTMKVNGTEYVHEFGWHVPVIERRKYEEDIKRHMTNVRRVTCKWKDIKQ